MTTLVTEEALVDEQPPPPPIPWTPASPLVIEDRVNFPGLTLDYAVGVVDPRCIDGPPHIVEVGEDKVVERRRCYLHLLKEMQFVYPQPRDMNNGHGTSAYAWFANRGDWIYALERTQRNAFVPYALSEWLKTLGQKLTGASARSFGQRNIFNCCLISYGIHSSWTHGEDPWHPEDAYTIDFFIGNGIVEVTLIHTSGATFSFCPAQGSELVWRGKDWTLSAQSEEPFFRLSYRYIHPMLETRQADAKTPHRLYAALRDEQRIVPSLLTPAEGMAVLQGVRPPVPNRGITATALIAAGASEDRATPNRSLVIKVKTGGGSATESHVKRAKLSQSK